MGSLNFEIQQEEDFFCVFLDGNLDFQTQEVFKAQLRGILADQKEPISLILDFEKLAFIDSSGVGSLLSLYKDFHSNRSLLKMVHVPENILSLLTITQVGRFIGIHKTMEEAIIGATVDFLKEIEESRPLELVSEFHFNLPVKRGITRISSRYILDLVNLYYKISEDDFHRMALALDEAINNALQHGYILGNESAPKKEHIVIWSFCYLDRIVLAIEDSGCGFTREQFQKTLGDVLGKNNFKWRGRGLFLMNRLVDGMAFDSRINQGSVFFLMKILELRDSS